MRTSVGRTDEGREGGAVSETGQRDLRPGPSMRFVIPDEVRAVLAALQADGIGAVLLHPADGFGPEHDVDIAVDRPLGLVRPIVLRSLRKLGLTPVAIMEYDIGGYESVVVGRLAGGSFQAQAIDIAHDPWGVGRYGVPMSRLIKRAFERDGIPTPPPGWEAVYLVSKRVQKGDWNQKLGTTQDLVSQDVAGFERAARVVLGRRWAARLTTRLARGPLVRSGREARGIRRAITLRRMIRAPWIPALRLRRAGRRLGRATGVYVLICGADGAGKSSLAAQLADHVGPLFRRTLRLHWRPGILPRPGSLIGRRPPDPELPHGSPPSAAAPSFARLVYYWLDHVVGYWLRIWPFRLRSGLILMERGFRDLEVDPRRYRVRLPPGILRAFSRTVPRADLTLVLSGSPAVFHDRKPELPLPEVARQTRYWEQIARKSDRTQHINAGRPPDEVLAEAIKGLLQTREEAMTT
jgi:hypothetical protein